MSKQLTFHNTTFNTKTADIVLVCDHVSSPANIGGLFRLCDALGIKKIFFCGNTIDISSSRIKRTARNTQTSVAYEHRGINNEVLTTLEKENFKLIALELTDISNELQSVRISKPQKIALIIGNERHGISQEVLNKVQTHVHIEMLGVNSSMNVIQATAIALYWLTRG